MFGEPRKYHVNSDGSDELEEQTQRARAIIERLAAHFAANEPERDQDERDIVEGRHVRTAAEFYFGKSQELDSSEVFVSYCHEDSDFIDEFTDAMTKASISFFRADRDIQTPTDWGDSIWNAIRGCRVFVSVVTPRFMNSDWRLLEGGAACASRKRVVVVRRYIEQQELESPFDRFQSIKVETAIELERLIERLKGLCSDPAA